MKKFNYIRCFLVIIVALSLVLTSCMTTKTSVGEFREIEGRTYTYASGKQVWLFWGFLPLGRTNVNTPGHGNCQIITKYTFFDVLIGGLTGGFVTTYTIRVRAKRE